MKQNPKPRGLQLYILLCKAVNLAARFLDVEPLWFATAAVEGAEKRGFSPLNSRLRASSAACGRAFSRLRASSAACGRAFPSLLCLFPLFVSARCHTEKSGRV